MTSDSPSQTLLQFMSKTLGSHPAFILGHVIKGLEDKTVGLSGVAETVNHVFKFGPQEPKSDLIGRVVHTTSPINAVPVTDGKFILLRLFNSV